MGSMTSVTAKPPRVPIHPIMKTEMIKAAIINISLYEIKRRNKECRLRKVRSCEKNGIITSRGAQNGRNGRKYEKHEYIE